MTTAQQIMNDSMERASIIGVGSSAAADDNTKALNILNEMLDSWRSDGIEINLGALTATDTVYVDTSDILCIKINLAVQLMDAYKLPVSDYVRRQANDLKNNLIDTGVKVDLREIELPDLLVLSQTRNILTDN